MKWNQKWTALALAGVMSLSLLAACTQTGGELTPPTTTAPATEEPSATPAPDVTEEPGESPDATPAPSEEPEESGEPSASTPPTTSQQPSQTPAPTPEPTPDPTPDPTEEPSETPAPSGDAAVSDIWAAIEASAEFPSLMDVNDTILSDLYGIDAAGDLEEYVAKMPLMNVSATEFFVAKVKDGRMDAVQSALEARQDSLEEQWSNYLPEQLALVQNYKLVTNGNYILFCIAENADQVVEIFNSYTK